MTTALLLINPNSRSGNSDLTAALQQLKEAGFDCIELEPDSRDGVSDEIIKNASKADLVIAGGGDGTVNAALRGIYKSGLPLAILPLGTANDFARSLKLPLTLEGAAKAITNNRQAKIDLGQLNDHYFVNVSHIGLAVDVARSSNDTEKKYLSVFAYLLAMKRALKRNHRFQASIKHDDAQMNIRCNHISVGSGRNYGGGMVISENASIDDSQLNLFSWRRKSLRRLFIAAIRMRSGSHTQLREVTELTAKKITIHTEPKLEVAADGEILSQTPVEYRCHAHAITAIVGEDF